MCGAVRDGRYLTVSVSVSVSLCRCAFIVAWACCKYASAWGEGSKKEHVDNVVEEPNTSFHASNIRNLRW